MSDNTSESTSSNKISPFTFGYNYRTRVDESNNNLINEEPLRKKQSNIITNTSDNTNKNILFANIFTSSTTNVPSTTNAPSITNAPGIFNTNNTTSVPNIISNTIVNLSPGRINFAVNGRTGKLIFEDSELTFSTNSTSSFTLTSSSGNIINISNGEIKLNYKYKFKK